MSRRVYYGRPGPKPGSVGEVPRSRGPLSNEQKARLCILAKAAYDVQVRLGRVRPLPGSASAKFEQWRREQQSQACGHASLRTANQSHYRAIVSHWLSLGAKEEQARTGPPARGIGGMVGKLLRTIPGAVAATREQTLPDGEVALEAGRGPEIREHEPATQPEDRAALLAHIAEALLKYGLHANYAAAIAQSQFRKPLTELPAWNLYNVLCTVRNRGAAKAKKAGAQNGAGGPSKPLTSPKTRTPPLRRVETAFAEPAEAATTAAAPAETELFPF